MIQKGLDPIVNKNTRVLILGSFPGVASLRKKEYYAHKDNHFWRIMFSLLKKEDPIVYSERIRVLSTRQIGIWNVLEACSRVGSCDHRILRPRPNDLPSMLKVCPDVNRIVLNGTTAHSLFRKYFSNLNIMHHRLQSTSSRNTIGYRFILRKWRASFVAWDV
jgi:hypoxanthine-DNA glycosylase